MIKVSIVGMGNISHHLIQAISKTDDVVVMQRIDSRMESLEETPNSSSRKQGFKKFEKPDIYILAVSDDAIVAVSKKLRNTKSLVVHTSGSVSIHALPEKIRRGVFYPLQTFSKQQKVDFKDVPICIEAENKDDLELLRILANSLSRVVHEIGSNKRMYLHLAAVFASNFTNHLYHIAEEICASQNLPFSLLKPLIFETAHKIESVSPRVAQTGPARRDDKETLEKHLASLTTGKQKEIYTLLSHSIQEAYGEEL